MKSVLERAYLRPLQRSLTAAYTQSLAAGFRTGPTPRTHPRFADGLRLALLSNVIMRCRVPSGTRGTRGASLSCMRGLSVRASALLLKLVCLSVCLSHSSSNGERVLVARHRSPPPQHGCRIHVGRQNISRVGNFTLLKSNSKLEVISKSSWTRDEKCPLLGRAGFKGGGANWAVAQGPPQLRGLHKKKVKNYYLRKH